MGLGIAAVQNMLELYQQGIFSNTKKVVEMGSQELHLKEADFEELVRIAGVTNYDRDNFLNLNNWPKQPRCTSKALYQMLGMEEYYSLDFNTDMGSIPHDYNLPFEDTSLWSQFDLVTDHGACEHAFNIGEAYRTMHRLCKPNGLIIISQMLWGGNGYFLYDKCFFEGIAAANNYKILFSSYVVATGSKTKNGSDLQFHIPINRDLLNTINLNSVASIGVYAVFEKQVDADFQFPYQGQYFSEEQGHLGFNRFFYKDPPSYSYIPSANTLTGEGISGRLLLKLLIQKIKQKVSSIFLK